MDSRFYGLGFGGDDLRAFFIEVDRLQIIVLGHRNSFRKGNLHVDRRLRFSLFFVVNECNVKVTGEFRDLVPVLVQDFLGLAAVKKVFLSARQDLAHPQFRSLQESRILAEVHSYGIVFALENQGAFLQQDLLLRFLVGLLFIVGFFVRFFFAGLFGSFFLAGFFIFTGLFFRIFRIFARFLVFTRFLSGVLRIFKVFFSVFRVAAGLFFVRGDPGTFKGAADHVRHIFRKGNIQFCIVPERQVTDGGQPALCGQHDLLQVQAFREGGIVDHFHGIRKNHAPDSRVSVEGPVTDFPDSFRNGDRLPPAVVPDQNIAFRFKSRNFFLARISRVRVFRLRLVTGILRGFRIFAVSGFCFIFPGWLVLCRFLFL